MDWSLHFDDDATTPRGEDRLLSSRATRGLTGKNYGAFVCFCFALNYVIGVGALGIPYAFARAGILLAACVAVVVTGVTIVTVNWTIEVCALANVHHVSAEESDPFLILNKAHNRYAPVWDIRSHYEVTQLCALFEGAWGKFLYQAAILILLVTGLWAYSAVFLEAMAAQLPLSFLSASHSQELDVWIYTGVFALLVIPLSCLDLTEQVRIQVGLTVARFLIFFILIGSTVVAIFNDPYDGQDGDGDGGSHGSASAGHPGVGDALAVPAGPPYVVNNPIANYEGFGVAFTTLVFAFLFQHSVPGLLKPVANKRNLKRIFGGAILTTASVYVVLGVVCALYFGSDVNPSINLNWVGFRFGYAPTEPLPTWCRVLSYLVVLFPALDTFSVFPLIALTLGNNLAYSLGSLLPERLTCGRGRAFILFCRLLAAAPPILLCLVDRNLSFILQISGFFGVYVAFVTPALLLLLAKRAVGPNVTTKYSSSVLSSTFAIALVLVFAASTVCYIAALVAKKLAT